MKLTIITILMLISSTAVADGSGNLSQAAFQARKLIIISKAEIAEKTNNIMLAREAHGELLFLGHDMFDDNQNEIPYFVLRGGPKGLIKPTCKIEIDVKSASECKERHRFYNAAIKNMTPEAMEYVKYETNYFNRVLAPNLK